MNDVRISAAIGSVELVPGLTSITVFDDGRVMVCITPEAVLHFDSTVKAGAWLQWIAESIRIGKAEDDAKKNMNQAFTGYHREFGKLTADLLEKLGYPNVPSPGTA